MTNPGWWQDVEEIIENHSLLKHPFYQAWQMGKLSLDDLRYYAAQYYPHVAAFPRYVSATHSNIDDIATRQILLDNLIEEEKGDENHPELWLRFAEALGVNRDDVLNNHIQPETTACVNEFMMLTRDANPLSGLAALYAYESQIPAVSATKINGLKEFYGMTDPKGFKFFDVHRAADVWHSRVEREVIQGKAVTAQDQEAVKDSVRRACRAVSALLDGVVRERQIAAAC